MKSFRVMLVVLALLALPFVAVSAQGQSADNKCKNTANARAQGTATATGLATAPGQLKKCPPPAPPPVPVPPPPAEEPPSGIHQSKGIVYEDVDGDGSFNMFAGELGLAGWTVQLYWNGQIIASTTSDGNGNYEFLNLGNASYSVCVIDQAGYTRTQPVNGTACGGAGYDFVLNNTFQTWAVRNFGMMM